MSFLEARQKLAQSERRRSARFTIDIPATLRTISGDRPCRMANISDNGAKLETAEPPKEGVSGWLVMGSEEIYCTVIWANDGACGVEFERALGEDRLIDIAGEQVTETVPIANTGKIQMGRKRSSLLRKAVSKEPEPQAELKPEVPVEPEPKPEPEPESQNPPELHPKPAVRTEPEATSEPEHRIANPAFISKRQAISAG